MNRISAKQILSMIQKTINEWHEKNSNRDPEAVIVTDDIKTIRPLGKHRNEIEPIVYELTITNTEIWHEEDKIRSMKDEVVLKAVRNINPLNQHRNDLIEEIDEIFFDEQQKKD